MVIEGGFESNSDKVEDQLDEVRNYRCCNTRGALGHGPGDRAEEVHPVWSILGIWERGLNPLSIRKVLPRCRSRTTRQEI